MKISAGAWRQGVPQDDRPRLTALLSTGDEKMDSAKGILVTEWKPTTNDLSVGELTELHTILGRGEAPFVPTADVETIAREISQRSDTAWIEEQAKKLAARKENQAGTAARLLDRGLAGLGGSGATWSARAEQIDAWWKAVTARQTKETWAGALGENRMSARQIGSTKTMGGTFTIRNKFARGDRSRDREISLDRGASGILARLVPDNFFDPKTGESHKNEKGLHDLSATLIDGKKDPLSIIAQLKPYEDSVVVFMPVPTEADAQIFAAIMSLTEPNVKNRGVLSSSFTRIRLAQGSDMHTTLLDVSTAATEPARVRYGVAGRVQRSKDEAERLADDIDIDARRTNALEHSVILGAGAMQKVNEIVMVYRAHPSALFPVFGKWNGSAKRFAVLDKKDWEPTGAYITDAGEWVDPS